MRELSNNGIPFAFEYVSCNESTGTSNGLTVVPKAMLRMNRHTVKDTAVAYTELNEDLPRFFHLPLLTKFNGYIINHEN